MSGVTRTLAAILLIGLITGCGLVLNPQGRPPERPPVTGEILGPVFAAPNGGPPIECRGLSRERCEGPGQIEAGAMDVALEDVERVIVSCESDPCDEAGGAFRIDVLLDNGSTQEIGAGGYGETEQP